MTKKAVEVTVETKQVDPAKLNRTELLKYVDQLHEKLAKVKHDHIVEVGELNRLLECEKGANRRGSEQLAYVRQMREADENKHKRLRNHTSTVLASLRAIVLEDNKEL